MAKTSSSRNVPRRSTVRKRSVRWKRPETLFAIFAVVTFLSLVVGLVGTAIVDELTTADTDDPIEFSPNEPGEYEQELRDAAAQHPDDPDALMDLAVYLSNSGNLDEAIEWYEKALALNPNDAILRLAFADALANGGKRSDAELQYKKAIQVQPNNPQAHFGLAELYRMWSPPRTEDALVEYNKTIEVGADSYVAELAAQEIAGLIGGTPSPVASPATPEGVATP
jgi:cytochrome c-type biogenesis protein CcmH/NrfG